MTYLSNATGQRQCLPCFAPDSLASCNLYSCTNMYIYTPKPHCVCVCVHAPAVVDPPCFPYLLKQGTSLRTHCSTGAVPCPDAGLALASPWLFLEGLWPIHCDTSHALIPQSPLCRLFCQIVNIYI